MTEIYAFLYILKYLLSLDKKNSNCIKKTMIFHHCVKETPWKKTEKHQKTPNNLFPNSKSRF